MRAIKKDDQMSSAEREYHTIKPIKIQEKTPFGVVLFLVGTQGL